MSSQGGGGAAVPVAEDQPPDQPLSGGPPATPAAKLRAVIDAVLQDPRCLAVAVAVIVGLITLFAVIIWSRRRNLRRHVLLVGPCDGGKTALFAQIVAGKMLETYTSQKENTASIQVPKKAALDLVDLPGHERLRDSHLDKYKSSARALVYVLDATTFQKQLRDVTNFLFNILTDPVLHRLKPALLIVCNKQDLVTAKASTVIRRELEKELSLLRSTQAKSLADTTSSDVSGPERADIGSDGAGVEFDQLNGWKVRFAEASIAHSDDAGLAEVKEWIAATA